MDRKKEELSISRATPLSLQLLDDFIKFRFVLFKFGGTTADTAFTTYNARSGQ